jgi:hypothetical protein
MEPPGACADNRKAVSFAQRLTSIDEPLAA